MIDLTAHSRLVVSMVFSGAVATVSWAWNVQDATVFVAAWVAYAATLSLA